MEFHRCAAPFLLLRFFDTVECSTYKPQVVHLDSKHFPKAYRVEGSIPYKTEDDVIIEAHPIWYKAVPQAGFELSWQNTGDPVSLTMTFDVLADADGNMFDLVFDGE